ncbi:MAG TPA: PIN domain-containing protein [Solirubrobacteraceae bacterium]|nr:PIN domain-containing protein [Solirubrobacteraceae bacterium]
MTGSLLDTSVLISRDESGALGLPEAAAISVISLGELRAGVQMARDERVAELRRGRLAAVRAAFAPLLVDEAVAERYGDVLAVARSQRRASKATDLLIIATAAAADRRLYTLDASQARLAQAAAVPATVLEH